MKTYKKVEISFDTGDAKVQDKVKSVAKEEKDEEKEVKKD